MMTLFAVLLFALLPLMALIVHTGFTTLTRRQMQSVVNTAAKEGLRSELSSGPSRDDVSTLASLVFDDDLHMEATPQAELDSREMVLGSGPSLTLSDGIKLGDSEFHASREITGLNDQIYPSGLETNTSDEVDGDMIAGQYDPDGSHVEPSSYVRKDFPLTGDPEYDPARGTDAFLVRLRRSGETFTGGVGSAGPTIPYLFGRVPYGNADGGTLLLNQRERGTIVRATAIARVRPVRIAGWYDTDVGSGLGPVVVAYSEWTGVTQPIPIDGSYFVLETGGPLPLGASRPSPGGTMDFVGVERYVAILDDATNRVIGFGSGTLSFDSMSGTGSVTRLSTAVAGGNASAQLLSLPSGLSTAEWDAVFAAHRNFDVDSPSYDSDTESLLAPVLVRTIN
jgi:hypothetical protein